MGRSNLGEGVQLWRAHTTYTISDLVELAAHSFLRDDQQVGVFEARRDGGGEGGGPGPAGAPAGE
jgi:hypothetical protein